MFHKFLTSASVIGVVAFGCLMFSGCRQPGNCRNGSCSAPSAGYGFTAPPQSYPAPGGSGTRSAPSGGSGTR